MAIFENKLFVSYCHADKEWVHALAKKLSTEFEVFLDEWSIVPGRPWRKQIEKGIEDSSAGIIVLSPDAVSSGAVDTEITVLIKKYWQEGRPLIPVLYRDSEIPSLLSTFQYVDFRKSDTDSLEHSMSTLRKAIYGTPPGPPGELPKVKLWNRPKFPLAIIFLISILILSLPLIARAIYVAVLQKDTITDLRLTQRSIQKIDRNINAETVKKNLSFIDGDREYYDPNTGERIAKDVWENGRLKWRDYYPGDNLIARDVFQYSIGEVTGKVRYHLKHNKRFLVDYFTQDGKLIRKEHYLPGRDRPDVYFDDMQSPLPPPGIVFYR